jgi:hypothetical protein
MRSPVRTIMIVVGVLMLLSLVQGFHSSAGASMRASGEQASAARAWTFSGKGSKKLGTFKLRHTAMLRWRSSGGRLLIIDPHGFRLLYTKARRGKLRIAKGTYRRLVLSARGSWKITIREGR